MSRDHVKKLLVTTLKVGLSAAIIVWLVWRATSGPSGENAFRNLVDQPKQWGMLWAAAVLSFAAVLLTLIRWCYLVRALEIPLSMRDALRIGFLGYLFNLMPMGIVGGDLLKAVMLAREHPGHRAKALASVVVDRLLGLYMLFVVAAVAIFPTGFWRIDVPEIRIICYATLAVAVAGALGMLVLWIPAVTEGRWTRRLAQSPRMGPHLESLFESARLYRAKTLVLPLSALMSVGVHLLFAAGVYCIARGLPGEVFPLGTFFVIMPLSAATGAIPLPMGPFEAVLEFLYTHVPASAAIPAGQGLVIALAYRLITLLISAVGIGYYITSRREVAEVMHEAEQ